MRYKDIYLTRYLNGERNFKREHKVFDYYETEELTGEKAIDIANTYYLSAFGDTNDSFPDITRIQIDLEHLDEEISKLFVEVIEHSETVSGDDDVFDYFPDLVWAFKQICLAVDKIEVYERLVYILYENKYEDYKDEDLF
jgi:hypothetical protein